MGTAVFAVIDRLPPHDTEAEESILAAVMVDNTVLHDVSEFLRPADFFREKNAYVYEAQMALGDRDEAINQVTVAHELARAERLEEVGGQTYLADIIRQLPTSIGARFYAEIVHRDSLFRRLISAAASISQLGFAAGDDVDGAYDRALELVDAARGQGGIGGDMRSLHDLFVRDGLRARVEDHLMDMKAISGLPTGWPKLDMVLNGWGHGTLTTVASETSFGKTAFMNNAVLYQVQQGNGVICFSTEMAAEDVAQRLVFMNAGVDRALVRRQQDSYNTSQFNAVTGTLDLASDWPVYIMDRAHLSIQEIRNGVRRVMTQRKDIKDWLVIVDLVDRVRDRGGFNRSEELTVIVQQLQGFAREQRIPIIQTSHVNRTEGQNILNKVSDSGAKVKDADNVIFLVPVARQEAKDGSLGGYQPLTPDAYRLQISQQGFAMYNVMVEKARHGIPTSILMRMDWWEEGGRYTESSFGR